MFYQVDRVIFNLFSKERKARCISELGSFMGVRERNGRTVNLYMYKSLFLEVLHIDDNSNNEIESISLIGNISRLNSHLESEFKKVFKRPTFSRELSA
jgi:hypothetical protein